MLYYTVFHTQQGRQSEPSVKTLRSLHVECWNSTLHVPSTSEQKKYKFKQILHVLEWGLNPNQSRSKSHFVPLVSIYIPPYIKLTHTQQRSYIKTNVESCVFLNILRIFTLTALQTRELHKLWTLIFIKEPPATKKYAFNWYNKISNAGANISLIWHDVNVIHSLEFLTYIKFT